MKFNRSFSFFCFIFFLVISCATLIFFNTDIFFKLYEHSFLYKKNILPCAYKNSSLETSERINQIKLFSRKIKKFDIAFYGDSIVANGMWDLLFSDFKILNFGGPGDTSQNILDRIDFIPKSKYSFILVGTNDFVFNCTVNEVTNNILNIYSKVNYDSQGNVYVLTALECNIFLDSCFKRLSKIRELNANLKKFQVANKLKLLDINIDLSDKNGLRASYTYDGTHLNAKGYSVLQNKIKKVIIEVDKKIS